MKKTLLALSRIIKTGALGFTRNGLLSIVTISIISLNLTVIGGLILFSLVTNEILKNIENKIDISVYFKEEIKEPEILAIQSSLRQLPEIKSVEYISKEKALEKFKSEKQNDTVIIESLQELGLNPLQNFLNIKAKNQNDYQKIIADLENPEFKKMIDNINFEENKEVIATLTKVINGIRNTGAILSLILSIIAILITFSAIKLAIHSLKEEISIMRLVGATNWYIRGPFLIEGIIYSVISAVISLIILYPAVKYGSLYLKDFLEGYDLLLYFKNNLINIFLFLTGIAAILGISSSIVAIRKYLRV